MRRRKIQNIIAVVMENGCIDTDSWSGSVASFLGVKIYLDFTDDSKMDSCITSLQREILSISQSWGRT